MTRIATGEKKKKKKKKQKFPAGVPVGAWRLASSEDLSRSPQREAPIALYAKSRSRRSKCVFIVECISEFTQLAFEFLSRVDCASGTIVLLTCTQNRMGLALSQQSVAACWHRAALMHQVSLSRRRASRSRLVVQSALRRMHLPQTHFCYVHDATCHPRRDRVSKNFARQSGATVVFRRTGVMRTRAFSCPLILIQRPPFSAGAG